MYRQLLIATNGILLSFDNVAQQDSVGFAYQNGTWTKLQGSVTINITTDGTFGLLPIFAVPYYVRVWIIKSHFNDIGSVDTSSISSCLMDTKK